MKKRIELLQSEIEKAGVDAIYLTSPVSHRYFTKFDNPDGSLLITKKQSYAFEDFRYTEIANINLTGIYSVIQPKGQIGEWLGGILEKENIKKLGIEDSDVTIHDYERLKKQLNVEFTGIGNIVKEMRQVKDEWEIEQINRAQIITDKAFSYILGILNADMTENDVAAELEYFMRKNGAEDKSFETIAVSGAKSSMPHGVPSDIKLSKGFLTMDFGATVNGYHSDMTRTVCIGKADEEMKKLYNTVLTAQLKSIEQLSAGKVCKDIDNIAREIIDKDYSGCFGHSLGHSVGLQIHEDPSLSPRCESKLVKGNVVTIEPGIYISGKYGCRIEDLAVIEDKGCRILTKSPKNLIEL